MPELPEVETVRRGLAIVLEGRVIRHLALRRPDLRFPLPKDLRSRVEGRRVLRLGRRGKFLTLHLDDAGVVIAHLGMSGRMLVAPTDTVVPGPHDHVLVETDEGMSVRFNDARRFGFIDLTDEAHLALHPMLRILGPEPLGDSFDAAVLEPRLFGRMTSIKAALLDQRVVAGLGNIYVSEALYAARISPRRLAATVVGSRTERLVPAIKDVLTRAIDAGGSSLRDYQQTSGELGYFQHQWAVYGKAGKPCPACSCATGVKRIVQSNRSTFYCPRLQR